MRIAEYLMLTDQTFTLTHYGDDAVQVSGLRFQQCFFDNSVIGPPSDPRFRSVFSDLYLQRCKQRACSLSGTIIDNVLVDGLGREGRNPLFLSGVALRHVTLKVRVGLFKLHPTPYTFPTTAQLKLWMRANLAHYDTVDWALDISEAQFTFAPDLHFIPGSLVRIDPSTQALVTREKAISVDLHSLPWGRSSPGIALKWFIEDSPYADVVLVGATKSAGFDADLAALTMLRERGIAEPT
jgi:hypothetical protein